MLELTRRRRLGPLVAVALAATAAGTGHGQIALSDQTAPTGVEFTHAPDPLAVPGLQEWMPSGIAVGDFDNDGWPDIFWASGGLVPDHLFMNNGDGTFTDRAVEWGLTELHAACGACAGDYNGDGWLDIYVTSFGSGTDNNGELGANRLYRNNGDGTFSEVAEEAGVNFTSYILSSGFGASFGDYDLDGDLDLAVMAWFAPAVGNRLYRNNGDGTFTDVSDVVLTFPSGMYAFQSCFADMDGDGWPELLVAADFSTSRYYRNNGDGTFDDVTEASGTGLDQNGMGQCVGDFNNDGLLDWYVTSIYADDPLPTSGEGNKLYMNLGDHVYEEVAVEAGVDDGGWGWGTVAADLDHDLLLDIVTVNGRPGSQEYADETEYVFRNNGDGSFTDVTQLCGMNSALEGKSINTLDFDRDGDMDLALGFNSDVNSLYENQSGVNGAWLHITFDTRNNVLLAPNGFGTRVLATVGRTTLTRLVDSGPSFLGTSEICAHFGLGAADVIDELRIEWPRGYVTVLENLPVNQHLVIESPVPADLDGDGAVGGGDLGSLLARWGSVTSAFDLKADLNNDHVVDAADLGLMLAAWSE